MSTITVVVTQEDIDKAKALRYGYLHRLSECCPIAQALRRIPSFQDYEVGIVLLVPSDTKKPYYRVPEVAQTFVRHFDNQEHVEPFEFELDLEKDVYYCFRS